MMDRGIIKWQPFNSCFNSQDIIQNIQEKRAKVNFPTLSPDQLNNLEIKIKNAYNLKLLINISYYYDGYIKEIKGQINYLDSQNKSLFINNKEIYFSQILNVH